MGKSKAIDTRAAVNAALDELGLDYNLERLKACAEACEGINGDPRERFLVIVSSIKQYGREEFRPENETADRFAALLRQKVLTAGDISEIKALGFRVMLKGGEL